MSIIKRTAFLWIFISIVVPLVYGTISPSDKGKKAKASKEVKPNIGPVDKSVFERNLIEDEPFARDILMEHSTYFKNTSARNFLGPTLGYVTPVSMTSSYL